MGGDGFDGKFGKSFLSEEFESAALNGETGLLAARASRRAFAAVATIAMSVPRGHELLRHDVNLP
jgi:hypothetical protein